MLSYLSSFLFKKSTEKDSSASFTDSHKTINLPKIEDKEKEKEKQKSPIFKKGLPIKDDHKPGINIRSYKL